MSAFANALRRALPGLLGGLMLLSGLAHAGTVTYVYTDPQGTPLAEADASGNITATFDYAPYGSQALGTPRDGPGYTGHVNDPESGLVYMQARYYDPAVGRFLSTDPVGVGNVFTFNRYDYANNNPIVNDDPDGKCTGSNISGTDGMCLGGAGSFVAGAGYSKFFYDSRESQRQMSVSQKGAQFIKGYEGWNGVLDKKTGRWKAKYDGFGNRTIGWGHNCGICAEYSKGITKLQGDDIFLADLRRIEEPLNHLIAQTTNQHQFDGLASFAYNVRNFQSSTLMHNVAFGKPVTEPNFTAYRYARKNGVLMQVPALLKRRESEWSVYANDIYDSTH